MFDKPKPKKSERMKTKISVKYNPAIFHPMGIFPNDDGFLCLICNMYLSSPAESWTHSNGPHHAIYLEMSKIYKQVIGMFACTLCTGVLPAHWKSFLLHSRAWNDLENLDTRKRTPINESFSNSRVFYTILEMSQVIEHEAGTYFCCCCGRIMAGWKTVFDHINETQHRERQQGCVYGHDEEHPEEESRKMVTNFVSHISSSLYYCYLCDQSISGRRNCHLHIDGTDHNKFKERIRKTNEEKHVINYQPLCQKIKRTQSSTTIIAKPVEDAISKFYTKLMRVNLITSPCTGGKYRCELCGCDCPGLPPFVEHLSDKKHRKLMENACSESLPGTDGDETSEGSSGSSVSIINSLYSWEPYGDKLESCESSENTSKSCENLNSISSGSWEAVSNESSIAELPEPKVFDIPEAFLHLISKHSLQKQEKELYCAACKAHLRDLRSLMNHTNNKRHVSKLKRFRAKSLSELNEKLCEKKSSIMKQSESSQPETKSQEDDKPADTLEQDSTSISLEPHLLEQFPGDILCLACNIHLTDGNEYIIHIKSKSHRQMLDKYNSRLSNKESTAKTLEGNIDPKSSTSAVEEKPSATKSQNMETETMDPQNSQSSLIDIPANLLSLIVIHSLKHLEKEVYCPACDVHIRDAKGVLSHTVSPKHAVKLIWFRARTFSEDMETQKALAISVAAALRDLALLKETLTVKSDPNLAIKRMASLSESIKALEKSVNKLTIVEVKTQTCAVANGDESILQYSMKNSISSKASKKLPQNTSKYSKIRQMNRKQLQGQNNKRINGRSFDPKYLNVDMKHIYEVDPEKLRVMKLSCQLCFPKTLTEIYCLICERSVVNELPKFYEHLCSTTHARYLAEVEQNDKLFTPYPGQFSDLSLAKEFLQQTSVEETIQCLACDTIMDNDDALISEHINQDPHKEGKQAWNVAMEWILQDILAKNESTWYNIQKYWCQPCDMLYNTEFHFAEHLDTRKHKNGPKKMGPSRNRLVYDACIPCATLWLGSSDIYMQHCDQPMHKYLLHSGDYSVCTLPGHVKTLLENSEAEVYKLIELSDQVMTLEKVKVDDLLKCLEDTVKSEFPEAKAYPFGSRVSGLGFPGSDIDVYLDCGTYDGPQHDEDFQMEIIMSAEDCFYANQQSWEIEETLTSSRTPIIKLRHRSTELSCDISFRNGLSVENTMLLKCFMDNYPHCRKLLLFIKKWLYFCNLSGSQYITNYAICWYVIFYLQSKSILPSIASMIAKRNKSKIIDGWETGICEVFDECLEEFTFTELLYGFFVFYTDFDYRYSVACPLLGSTVPKQDFTELHLLPKEMAPYIKQIKSKGFNGPVELFRIDSEMCIQDPYDLSHNLTKAVRKFTLNRFKQLCAASADVLNNLNRH